ncbi:FAD-dependent monooxygenase [Curtobacterium sp. MCLR17_043]|uniref:FAD-dependent oxidoreductase n=1 Tax=unclassified Curtobacterium TaxID=257496 RepID=UPI000D8D1919|nr:MULTISPECIES: NAD(P)/FAD-dependent oxidoreductase [unclassified Curtobacterium]PYY48965.1 FAD-dependent monooxygenase [Curtobacterium sp. MCLR17_043]PZF11825.1 FAD-dependent monooxygenase [Curtobacterium sp. MCLR17_034]
MKALIVGGGIAGLAAAIALHQGGHTPIVLERGEKPAQDEGSWLQVASNGIRALHNLGLGAAVSAGGFPTPLLQTFDFTGRLTATLPLGSQEEQLATRSIQRAFLYRILRAETLRRGITIQPGTRVLSVTDEGDKASVLTGSLQHFAADIVIGADGIGSAVRRSFTARNVDANRYTAAKKLPNLINLGGTYTSSKLSDTDGGATGTLQFHFGRDCFVGSVRVDASTIWWFANPRTGAVAGGMRAAAGMRSTDWQAALPSLLGSDALPVSDLLAGSGPLDVSHSRPPRPTLWGRGRVVLIGDAAHAIPPTAGQGASLALEDAVVLGQLARRSTPVAMLAASMKEQRGRRVANIARQGALLDRSKTLGAIGAMVRDGIVLPSAAKRALRNPIAEMYRFNPTD